MNKNKIDYLNIIVLGLSFMFIFSAFQTCEMIQEIVLENFDPLTFKGAGYKSLAIIYAFFALSNWFAAAIVLKLGSKLSLIFGASTYCIFIGVFFKPTLWALYLSSIILGIGASVLWTAQGNFITFLSTPKNISKNMGIFWALFQASFLIGNAIMYFKFQGIANFDSDTLLSLFTILFIFGLTGVIMMIALLKNVSEKDVNSTFEDQVVDETSPLITNDYGNNLYKQLPENLLLPDHNHESIPTNSSNLCNQDNKHENITIQTFKMSLALMQEPNVSFLFMIFVFTGLQITFIGCVLTTSIGYTERFGSNAKSYMGICGMVLGAGEILGALNFGFLGSILKKKFRLSNETGNEKLPTALNEVKLSTCSRIMAIGFVFSTMSYFIFYLVLPTDSPIQPSLKPVYLTEQTVSLWLIIFASLLLGLADSAYSTQIYVLIATHFREKAANTALFALFKFIQSSMAAIAFFYSKYMLLHWQLFILVVTSFLGTLSFFMADYGMQNKRNIVLQNIKSDTEESGDDATFSPQRVDDEYTTSPNTSPLISLQNRNLQTISGSGVVMA